MIDYRSDTWTEICALIHEQVAKRKDSLANSKLSEKERDGLCGEIAGLRWVLNNQSSAAVVTRVREEVLDGS